MDPTANIEEQTRILASDTPDWARLADLVLALDEWLANGGFLPADYTPGALRIQRSDAVKAMQLAGVDSLLDG